MATQRRERICILAALCTPGSQREVGAGWKWAAFLQDAARWIREHNRGFLVDGLGYEADIGLSTISETDELGHRAKDLAASAAQVTKWSRQMGRAKARIRRRRWPKCRCYKTVLAMWERRGRAHFIYYNAPYELLPCQT